MLPYDLIQASASTKNVRQTSPEISATEAGMDIQSTTLVPTLQDTTTSCHVSNDNRTNIVINQMQRRRRRLYFDPELINLESHQLVFLDDHPNDGGRDETMFILDEFRQIVSYIKFINNVEEALHFLDETKDTITFLICSSSFDQTVIPRIHLLKNIRSIYIHCREIQHQKKWSDEYTKVKKVYTDLQLLLHDLGCDVTQYLQQRDGIFNDIGRDNNTIDTWTFSWWNYVIAMICHLTYPENCLQTFLTTLRDYNQGREHELKALDEFERTFSPETAIRWYTRDSFIYRVLNRAFRQRNIEVIFLFAFFIKDMYVQLQNEHNNLKNNHVSNPKVKVYRGQIIAMEEIKQLKVPTQFINTSFLSTSLDRDVASLLLDPSSRQGDPLQNVLFEIELDTHLLSQPFGNISALSHFRDENEVLIMIGSWFKVTECSYNDSVNAYVVKIALEEDSVLERQRDLTGMTPRRTLKSSIDEILNHLYCVGFEDINRIFVELYDLFPCEKDWLNAIRCHCNAKLYQQFRLDRYPEHISDVMSNFEQALPIYQSYIDDCELDCDVDICNIHHSIASIYQSVEQDDILAIKHYDLGIATGISSLQTTTSKDKRMHLYGSIVSMHENKSRSISDESERKESILNSIKYQQLQLDEMSSYLPPTHSNFISGSRYLAGLHSTIGHISEALTNYEKVVQIHLAQHEPDYHSIAEIYGEISKMYIEQKTDYALALLYKQEELEYRKQQKVIRPDTNEHGAHQTCSAFAEIYHDLANMHTQLSQYELAHENLLMSKYFYQNSGFHSEHSKILNVEREIRTMERFLSKD